MSEWSNMGSIYNAAAARDKPTSSSAALCTVFMVLLGGAEYKFGSRC